MTRTFLGTLVLLGLPLLSNCSDTGSAGDFDVRDAPPESASGAPRWALHGSANPSPQMRRVLNSAFGTEFDSAGAYLNAYNFVAANGSGGMDWWNFPWDLSSSKPQYTLDFHDMEEMILHADVKTDPLADAYVPYAQMLSHMTQQLTPAIMNNHGGALRVVKIIYCVRNFLSVAIDCSPDHARCQTGVQHLRAAAKHLVSLDKVSTLKDNSRQYSIANWSPAPTDLRGNQEDRSLKRGVRNLQQLLAASKPS